MIDSFPIASVHLCLMFNYFEYNIFLNICDKNLFSGKQKRAPVKRRAHLLDYIANR